MWKGLFISTPILVEMTRRADLSNELCEEIGGMALIWHADRDSM
jgi:hypothetical protein